MIEMHPSCLSKSNTRCVCTLIAVFVGGGWVFSYKRVVSLTLQHKSAQKSESAS